ncbi:hypothetical protein G7Y89_g4819 [Cudoniella acicularis]|uniref:AB hydrolase-1 domain-containing protein n=1 Tax=Cudoniella acicularis TaxID=354080 RepID=A0A8H4RNP4_9HELO|nr:hypothetical protein G7Y89_g4819 [Cudoniella acicularis]
MSKSLPTIVVVPGAWHSPSHYAELMKHLQEAGYPTSSAPLPSLDPSAPDSVTTSHDSDFIRQTLIQPLLDANQEIILIMHSYGGSPGGVAARGLSLKERLERGEKGGIIGLVFIAAFLAHEGMSLKSAVGGTFAPWVDIDSPAPGLLTPLTPLSVFYQDVSAEIAATAIKELKPISANALSTPTKSAPAWKEEGYQGRHISYKMGSSPAQQKPTFTYECLNNACGHIETFSYIRAKCTQCTTALGGSLDSSKKPEDKQTLKRRESTNLWLENLEDHSPPNSPPSIREIPTPSDPGSASPLRNSPPPTMGEAKHPGLLKPMGEEGKGRKFKMEFSESSQEPSLQGEFGRAESAEGKGKDRSLFNDFGSFSVTFGDI